MHVEKKSVKIIFKNKMSPNTGTLIRGNFTSYLLNNRSPLVFFKS